MPADDFIFETDLPSEDDPRSPIKLEYTIEEWDLLSEEEKKRVYLERERQAQLPPHLRDL